MCCGVQVVRWCWRARWYPWCALGVEVLGDVLGEVLGDVPLETWRLKPRLMGSVAQG